MNAPTDRDQNKEINSQPGHSKFFLKMREEIEMKFTSISEQLNSGIHHGVASTIAIKNSAKTFGPIALAGMVAVTANLGPISADGPGSASLSTAVTEGMGYGLWELHYGPTYDAPLKVAASRSNVLPYGYDESTIAPNLRTEAANVFGLNGPWPTVAASSTVKLANQDFDLWAMHYAPSYDARPSITSSQSAEVATALQTHSPEAFYWNASPPAQTASVKSLTPNIINLDAAHSTGTGRFSIAVQTLHLSDPPRSTRTWTSKSSDASPLP